MTRKPIKSAPTQKFIEKNFPAYKVLPVASLIPYARNARTHSEEQIAQIAASIREFGFTNPVLVDEGNGLIAGHGRVLAARKLEMVEVPAVIVSGLSEAQKRALVLADNKLALNAGWDEAMLRIELADLQGMGFDVGLTGFGATELSILFAGGRIGQTDPDDVPALEERAVSRLGDVWLMGNHRLCCGDSTTEASVRLALAGAKPHLMVTDPPYGVKYDPSWRTKAGMTSPGAALGNVLNDDRADWREAWALFPGTVAYVWHAGTMSSEVAASLEALRFKVRAQIVWIETRLVLSRGDYHAQHEPAFYATKEGPDGVEEDDHWHFVPEHELAAYAVKEGSPGQYRGGRKQSTVWMIEHVKSETGHGTQKPMECMKRPMENNSLPGDAVYEPFSGSGTSIIAAEISGRTCLALELSPLYVDMAVRRWQNFTGAEAMLEGGGARGTPRSFAKVAVARLADPAEPVVAPAPTGAAAGVA